MQILKQLDTKGRIGAGMIKAAIIGLVFMTVLVSILPSLINTSAISVQTLSDEYSNTTLYGTSASTIGTQIDNWAGYFWVLGPFIMVIGVITGIFMKRRG